MIWRGPIAFVLGLFTLAGLSGCGDSSDIDSSALQELLNQQEEALIVLESGTLEGPFVIQHAVTLRGADDGSTILSAPEAAVLLVEGNPAKIRLENLTIDSEHVGLLAEFDGDLELENVTFQSAHGVGAYIHDVANLTMNSTTFKGGVTADQLTAKQETYNASEFAVIGLYVDDVANAQLTSVNVSGYAGMPVIFHRSAVIWTNGIVTDNAGMSVVVETSEATFENVTVQNSLQSTVEGSIEPIGVTIADTATLTSTNLTIQSMGGHGLLQDHAQSSHSGLRVTGAKYAGVWVQDSVPDSGSALSLTGESSISENQGSGLVFLESTGLSLTSTSLLSSVPLETPLQMDNLMPVSDGLHLQAASGDISLTDVTVEGHERVGVAERAGVADVCPGHLGVLACGGTQLGGVSDQCERLPPRKGAVCRKEMQASRAC